MILFEFYAVDQYQPIDDELNSAEINGFEELYDSKLYHKKVDFILMCPLKLRMN